MATSQAKAALRQYRRDHGLCVHCGAVAQGTRCATCAAKEKVNKLRANDHKKSQGLCLDEGCHALAVPGKYYCAACAARRNRHDQRRTTARQQAGQCVDCGQPATNGQRCAVHAAARSTYMRSFHDKRKAEGRCVSCGDQLLDATTDRCVRCRQQQLDRYRRLKLAILEAYGGPVCVGCSEPELWLLQIDHIAGGGHAHALKIGNGDYNRGRSKMYQWLRDNGYPPGYRVLCANCNIRAARGLPFPNDSK